MNRASGLRGETPAVRVSAPAGADDAERVYRRVNDATDDVPVARVGSTGVREFEPLVLLTANGETAYYPECGASTAVELTNALADGDFPAEDASAVVSHGADTPTLPTPDEGPLSVGVRDVLGPCGWLNPLSPADAEFGFSDALDTVSEVGVLGRGRGDVATDEPIATAWRDARDADGDALVVVNANEADDRTRGDELLLESAPLRVLAAADAAATATDATDVVVYVNEDAEHVEERVREAAQLAADDLDAPVQVVTGPDDFRAGEMTMALEAMEGSDRIEARKRPPYPTTQGLHGRPTVIHTPRTLAQVERALREPEAFDPESADPGTRLVTVTGDVEHDATVELPTSGSLADARDAVSLSGDYGFASVGGQFGGFARDLDVTPSAPALRAADLGTNGALELLDDDTCPVAEAGERARFAREENCGRCVPCREGSVQLVDLLRDVYDGRFDADGIRELARVMRSSSTCDFGQTASRPVTTALDEFGPAFRAHADGRCPTGTCNP